jgi:UDP-N-acetylmuramate dehydrogenase
MGWRRALGQALGNSVQFDTSMARRVAFKIGGNADAFARPESAPQLLDCLRICREFDIPLTILGTGSNILVSDEGIRGVTARLSESLCEIRVLEIGPDYGMVEAGAGALNPPVVSASLENGLVGIEFLATIPGTFGGALIMNAGAHGGEIGAFVQSVEVISENLAIENRLGSKCGFQYRQSTFSKQEIITKALLKIPMGSAEQARAHLKDMRMHRRATQPIKEPNAGSIFKNPPGDYAGRLIEACGLKGMRHGGALISPKHANFIVNENNAKAVDVVALAKAAQTEVNKRFNIRLEWEVKRIGQW